MYAENGVMFPYFQSFSPDVHQFDDLCYSQKSNSCLGSVVQSSVISDYDFGGEGDLFKAPEPIIEQQPLENLDAMLMIACGEDNLSSQELIESFQNEEFLSDVLNDYKEIETSPLSEVLNYKIHVKTDEIPIVKENVHPPGNGQIPKSVSSDCLRSMKWIHEAQMKHGVLNLMEGMRRAFSEGDIKLTLNFNKLAERVFTSEHTNTTMEDRWQKLSRYRNKKSKRNFGRKIKYACRKALAESQPRIRGRFAKTEESEILRK